MIFRQYKNPWFFFVRDSSRKVLKNLHLMVPGPYGVGIRIVRGLNHHVAILFSEKFFSEDPGEQTAFTDCENERNHIVGVIY